MERLGAGWMFCENVLCGRWRVRSNCAGAAVVQRGVEDVADCAGRERGDVCPVELVRG